jgi:hypothetical protein
LDENDSFGERTVTTFSETVNYSTNRYNGFQFKGSFSLNISAYSDYLVQDLLGNTRALKDEKQNE